MEEITGNFIHDIIDAELAAKINDEVHTRFPPEPNGYLHIGSAKAIWINYSTAKKYGGKFNLRFDDTNPMKESDEFVKSIEEDLNWLGAIPDGGIFFGSDYFEKCYEYAVKLIKDGKAYVCQLSKDDLAEYRGSGDRNDVGKPSPYRDRPIEESLDLFERMKNGEFEDGAMTLRAKIDPNSDNPYMRDPVIYRIRHVHHHRQGDKWCIYPMYDYAHPLQDSLEGITYSLCSSEFKNHRPLYEWVVDNCGFTVHPTKQREFGRMNVTYTVMSKRFLRYLVEKGLVDGWDDPRMPTLKGLRRRGYTPSAIFDFVSRAGVAKADTTVDVEMLEHCQREELNRTAERRICVLHPIKVVIDNFPDDKTEYFPVSNNPNDENVGTRNVPFTKEIFIDSDDFAELPPPKFFRMKPDGEVRLMGAYIVRCNSVEKNPDGSIKEIHCSADLETGNGNPADGRKIKGTIHWVSAKYAEDVSVTLYDRLFTIPDVANFTMGDHTVEEIEQFIDPDCICELHGCKAEPSLKDSKVGESFQFVRTGYFTRDSKNPDTFLRTVTLKDSFPAKQQ